MIHASLAPYMAFLDRVLTPARKRHSLGVMQVMGELAEIYDLPRATAMTAGLLHDAAKDLSVAQQVELMADSGIQLADPCEADYNFYLHGPAGAYYVEKELGIKDCRVLEAIARHTWCGSAPDLGGTLVWCLRFADILEPGRVWNSAARAIRAGEPALRKLVFSGRLEEAMLQHTSLIIQFLEDMGQPVHPNFRTAYRVLSARQACNEFIEE